MRYLTALFVLLLIAGCADEPPTDAVVGFNIRMECLRGQETYTFHFDSAEYGPYGFGDKLQRIHVPFGSHSLWAISSAGMYWRPHTLSITHDTDIVLHCDSTLASGGHQTILEVGVSSDCQSNLPYSVDIDGDYVGNIMSVGETEKVALTPGVHTYTVSNDFVGFSTSGSRTVEPGEWAHVKVSCR